MKHSDLYQEEITRLTAEVAQLKTKSRGYMTAEIVSFLLFIALIVAYTVWNDQPLWLYVSPVALVSYFVARRMDERNDEAIERREALRQVYANELSYTRGDFSCFRDGGEYADAAEPFAYDLDVFGPQSLFNRVNRTLTTGGSQLLARCLSSVGMTKSDIEARHDAVNELAGREKWRANYMSSGVKGVIDTTQLASVLDHVCHICLPSWAASNITRAIAVLSITGLWVSIVFAVSSGTASAIASTWAVVQLMVAFLTCGGRLKTIGAKLDRLHSEMKATARLVRLVTKLKAEGVTSAELKNIISSLDEAEECFTAMEKLTKRFDKRGSLVLLFTDMLFMSDFFLLRDFALWQTKYRGRTEAWIAAISQIDTIVSMATFRYNEPEACSAEITDDAKVVYEARGLYHPFLGANAVTNDFTIDDHNYYIVTGANMAGKSTFLRSIGVNYILAMNGMPVFARSLKVSRFSLFSSMRTTDDLAHGISYFNAELLRLKQLIAYCREHQPTLIILDEILKGTNSLDKLNGSRLFLEYISHMDVSGIIATHDLKLSEMESDSSGRFHNYCFEIELGNKVTYSYKLTPGVARNQNATFLLKSILNNEK